MSDRTPDELAFQMVRAPGSMRAAYVHVWGPKDFSALKRALARHPATEAKNVLQEAVEADCATEYAELAPVIDLADYRRRRA